MLDKRIKELREKKDMSQAELANILGVAQQTVASWERGKSSPNYEILQSIANFFHVSTDYLLGRDKITLGEYIRMARQHVAYSPEYVETLTGIKADTLISWERNQVVPSSGDLERLARLYHVSVEVLTGKDTRIDSRRIRPILSAEENLAADLFHRFGGVVKALAKMSPAKQEQAASYIAFLAQDDKKA